jgi:dihydroorotase-like cyclic amidohydrolase
MFDLIIRGGDVVTPEGVVRCDVAVAGETIAAIATSGTLSADSAKHLIDATGHIVMPGGIDPHVHLLHHGKRGAKRSTAVHSAREFA